MIASASITITHITDGLTTFYQYAKTTSDSVVPTTGWSTNMPSSEPGKFIWRREAIALALEDVGEEDWGNEMCLTGAKGDTGETGPTGPPGIIGKLGITTSGTTIFIKGYAEDGSLTASQGYLYIGQSRLTVPQFSQTLVNEGQGYIVLNESNSAISLAVMAPEASYVKWLEFDTPANAVYPNYIIGRFYCNGTSISDAMLIEPVSPLTFTKSHMMEVLADRGWTDLTDWGEALGITQLFESLAVWDFFADKIKTNHIEIEKMVGSKNFKLIMTANHGTTNPPVIEAYSGGDLVFQIDSSTGNVYIKGSGTFQGTLEHESLLTKGYQPGAGISVSNTKNLWKTTDAYNEITQLSVSRVLQSASGSFKGKSFNAATRLSARQGAEIGSYSQPNRYTARNEDDDGDRWYTLAGIYTVPPHCNSISFSYFMESTMGYNLTYITKNPGPNVRTLGSITNDTISPYFTPGTKLYSWSGSGDVSGSLPIGSFQSGDLIAVWVTTNGDYTVGIKNIVLKAYSTLTGPGIFLRYTDNTYGIVSTDYENHYRTDEFSMSSPSSWVSSSNYRYKKGNDLFNHSEVQKFSEGVPYTCTGTITVHHVEGTTQTYSVQAIRRNPSSVTFDTSSGPVTVNNWGGEGSAYGAYHNITVSITLIGQERAVEVSSIIPKNNNDGKDSFIVGSGSKPFTAGNFVTVNATTLNGNVNSSGTSYKVWGAVAN